MIPQHKNQASTVPDQSATEFSQEKFQGAKRYGRMHYVTQNDDRAGGIILQQNLQPIRGVVGHEWQ